MSEKHVAPMVGRRSPGLVTIGYSEDDSGEPMPEWVDECVIVWREKPRLVQPSSWFKRSYECGHRGARRFRLSIFGEESSDFSQRELCPECALEFHRSHTARCCYCTRPIFVGSSVCIYTSDSPGIVAEAVTEIGEGVVLGCMRWGCGNGGSFAGHWTHKGFKQLDFSKL